MTENSKEKKPSKVLILGLDNSGKTSILLSLKSDTNILSFYSLKPTKGLNIERIGENMSIWDFGGQEQYRNDYLKDFDKYLGNVDKIIYIIDVQDMPRYAKSLDYLKKLIDRIKQKVEFSIFLHKYDPNLENIEGLEDIDQIVEKELIQKIDALLKNKFKFKVFKTSIHTVFDKIFIYEAE